MATTHSTPSSPIQAPQNTPTLDTCPSPEQLQSPAKRHARWRPRKRRLTTPPDFQPTGTGYQTNKKARVAQESDREVQIIDEVDDLIPKIRVMGKGTSLFTPQSSGFDASSIPFVFNDGFFSFCTPSPYSSDFGPSASPPGSSASNASFLGVLPDSPRSGKPSPHPALERLTIWRDNDEETNHIYAQTSTAAASVRETVSLENLDPSLIRYGSVHTAITQTSCQFIHVDISLTAPSAMIIDDPHPINSMITISTPRRTPVRLLTAIYNSGSLVSSYETAMKEAAPSHFGNALYSASLPQQILDELCKDAASPCSAKKDSLDSVAVMRFVQQTASAEVREDEVVLIAVCDFHTHKGPLPGQVKVSHLWPGNTSSRELFSESRSLPIASSREILEEAKGRVESATKISGRQRVSNRVIPKLSVAIPPPSTSMHGAKGRIQLYSDSPDLTPDTSVRPTPHTGVPHNVFPVTPFDQLIHTPLYPPELPRGSTRNRAGYAPTPTESAYPFTLSSTSPSSAQSPAFAVLDTAGSGGSAPAWLNLSRNETPLTPSFFLRHPHTASASNAMSSMTQRALDSGTPTFSPSRRETYYDQPLASPHPIASAPLFPPTPTNASPPAPSTAPPGLPSAPNPQSS